MLFGIFFWKLFQSCGKLVNYLWNRFSTRIRPPPLFIWEVHNRLKDPSIHPKKNQSITVFTCSCISSSSTPYYPALLSMKFVSTLCGLADPWALIHEFVTEERATNRSLWLSSQPCCLNLTLLRILVIWSTSLLVCDWNSYQWYFFSNSFGDETLFSFRYHSAAYLGCMRLSSKFINCALHGLFL